MPKAMIEVRLYYLEVDIWSTLMFEKLKQMSFYQFFIWNFMTGSSWKEYDVGHENNPEMESSGIYDNMRNHCGYFVYLAKIYSIHKVLFLQHVYL